MHNMHFGMMKCFKECFKKFKISKENKGDKLEIIIAGSKDDVAKLDKKIDAMHVLLDGCCDGKDGDSCC